MHDKEIKTADYQKAEAFILGCLQKELSTDLAYHGYHHTLDVMNAAMNIAAFENLSTDEIALLRVAVAFHDSGFIYTHKNHEEKGCRLAEEYLPGFHFTPEQTAAVCSMIMATKIPQQPKTRLESILCDADLDYLGREDAVSIAHTLFLEQKLHIKNLDEKSWDEMQIGFLRTHQYHTSYSLAHRDAGKQAYLQMLLRKWQ
ncbi:HD domain-containing protein [Lacibacter sp. H375]|uniref:HD domain-containing protein n=1 Tax=Lacibacter sp. H375 TaxID=3133424 RepID=UPI0030BBFF00